MARFGRTYVKLGLVRPVVLSGATTSADNSDTEGLTDNLSFVVTAGQVPSDTEGLTDSLSFVQTEIITQPDSEGLTDSVTLSQTEPFTQSDAEGLTDSVVVGLSLPFTKSDPEGLTDSLSLTLGNAFIQSDSEGLSDSLATSQIEVFSKSDTEGLTDSVALVLGTPYNPSDAEGLTDSLSTVLSTTVIQPEALGLTDSLSLVLTLGPTPPSSLGPEGKLVMGPGTIYVGAYGAVEPTNGSVGTAPNSGVWTDVGGLLGGVDLTVENDWITVDLKQIPDQPMRRLRKRRLTIKTMMAEPTLSNLAYALNDTAAVSGVVYEPSNRSEASQLTYNALVIDGWAPGWRISDRHQKRRRIIVRKALSIDNVEFAYSKDNQSVYTVTWSCHYVDGTTPPFRIIDEA
jgi:hypothetical protein